MTSQSQLKSNDNLKYIESGLLSLSGRTPDISVFPALSITGLEIKHVIDLRLQLLLPNRFDFQGCVH